jgi:hypothetical protein
MLEDKGRSLSMCLRSCLGAPQARPAGAEPGMGGPASDGDGGAGGAKPPGLVKPINA